MTYGTPFFGDEVRTVGRLADELHRTDPRMTAACAADELVHLGAPLVIR